MGGGRWWCFAGLSLKVLETKKTYRRRKAGLVPQIDSQAQIKKLPRRDQSFFVPWHMHKYMLYSIPYALRWYSSIYVCWNQCVLLAVGITMAR